LSAYGSSKPTERSDAAREASDRSGHRALGPTIKKRAGRPTHRAMDDARETGDDAFGALFGAGRGSARERRGQQWWDELESEEIRAWLHECHEEGARVLVVHECLTLIDDPEGPVEARRLSAQGARVRRCELIVTIAEAEALLRAWPPALSWSRCRSKISATTAHRAANCQREPGESVQMRRRRWLRAP
jgi:hypothetical protein